jgi:hypothetical protein
MITNDVRTLAKNELNFVSFIVEPMWRSMQRLFPALSCCVQHLETNKERWRNVTEGNETLNMDAALFQREGEGGHTG